MRGDAAGGRGPGFPRGGHPLRDLLAISAALLAAAACAADEPPESQDVEASGAVAPAALALPAPAGPAHILDMEGALGLLNMSYGWAWLIFLHAELDSWDDPEAEEWADRIEPLARLLSDRMAEYLKDREEPVRSGTHGNTAFAISLSLRAVEMAGPRALEKVLRDAAVRFFANDGSCPVADEPGRSDFLSPCLEEAALMAEVMDPDDFVPWLDSLLPPMDSADFDPLRVSALSDSADGETGRITPSDGSDARIPLTTRSHLIGLSFTRADAMLRIAAALPDTDPRAAELRRLANTHASAGFESMFDAEYAGSHWIGTFALKYLMEAKKESDP